MPQTKPMMWIKFMIFINLLSLMMLTKLFHTMSLKNKKMFTQMKTPSTKMKW